MLTILRLHNSLRCAAGSPGPLALRPAPKEPRNRHAGEFSPARAPQRHSNALVSKHQDSVARRHPLPLATPAQCSMKKGASASPSYQRQAPWLQALPNAPSRLRVHRRVCPPFPTGSVPAGPAGFSRFCGHTFPSLRQSAWLVLGSDEPVSEEGCQPPGSEHTVRSGVEDARPDKSGTT